MAIIKKIRSIFKRIIEFLSPSNKLPGIAQKLIAAFVVLFLSAVHILYLFGHVPPLYLIAYLLFYIACGLVLSILFVWLLKLSRCIPSAYQVAIIFSYLAAFYFFHLPANYGWLLILSVIILPVLVITGVYQWKKGALFPLKSPKRILWFSILLISSVALFQGLLFYWDRGVSHKLL